MGLFCCFKMSLKQEISKELHSLAELMDKTAGPYGYNEIFADWIDYMVACFSTDGDPKLAKHLQEKYTDCYAVFDRMLKEYLYIMEAQTKRHEWYDGLGIIYEAIASRWKSSKMGQFFTPPSIVDLMVAINTTGQEIGKGKTVNDPTCGSGRLLIAHHAAYPGNRQYGQDLDPICAKMTAVNMLLHGCVGEVSCMNTITMEWYFGFYVNPYLSAIRRPQLVRVRQYQDSNFWTGGSIYDINKVETYEDKAKKQTEKRVIQLKKAPVEVAQLSLF